MSNAVKLWGIILRESLVPGANWFMLEFTVRPRRVESILIHDAGMPLDERYDSRRRQGVARCVRVTGKWDAK